MQHEYIDQPEDLVIIGLSTRTSPATAATAIPALWQRFLANPPGSDVERRANDAAVYAVYSDYQSDFQGEYTLTLGVAVEADAQVPDDLRRVRVPRGRYACFHAQGDPRDVIWRTWSFINQEWEQRAGRRYIADVERYDSQTLGERDVSADILVGLA
jgi:predicted transcriptional regulator YdeE